MEFSYGIAIIKHSKVLVCHMTGFAPNRGWNIPKGHAEEGEHPLSAAIRETREETGLEIADIKKGEAIDLGDFRYKSKRKTLHAYAVFTDKDIRIEDLYCDSYFSAGLPEVDEYRFVTLEEGKALCHHTFGDMTDAIKGLLP